MDRTRSTQHVILEGPKGGPTSTLVKKPFLRKGALVYYIKKINTETAHSTKELKMRRSKEERKKKGGRKMIGG
jgi:hypothetical protein